MIDGKDDTKYEELFDDPENVFLDEWSGEVKIRSRLVALAGSGAGKSYLLRHLLYKNQHKFECTTVVSKSNMANGDYKFIHEIFIYDNFDLDTLKGIKQIMIRQQEKLNNWTGTKDEFYEKHSILIILDDALLIKDKKIKEHPIMNELYKMGRHWGISVWVILQYMVDLPVDFRDSLSYVIGLRQETDNGIKKLGSLFATDAFGPPKKFQTAIKQYTDKFGCVIKDMNTGSNDFRQRFFWYKAKPTPDDWKFKPNLWRLGDKYYLNPNEGKVKRDLSAELERDPLSILDEIENEAIRVVEEPFNKKRVVKSTTPAKKEVKREKFYKVDLQGNIVD